MDLYKSARKIGGSGKLKKNKGIMFTGAAASNYILEFRGLSGDSWVSSTSTVSTVSPNLTVIIPVSVYGITFGSGGDVYELN